MRTKSSLRAPPPVSCSESVPPLTPLAYITMLFVPYIAIVFGNAVTLRQIQYAEAFEDFYGKPFQPLPDTPILENVEIPTFGTRLALRDYVNVLAAGWCTLMAILWLFRRNYTVFTTFLATEALVVPVFAMAQWMTTVIDSDPNCLSSIDVPEDDGWIWWRVSLVQCGDMLWSSAIVQTIIFSVLGFGGYKSRFVRVCGGFTSSLVVVLISILAWVALYQYACDVVISVFVTLFIATHPVLRTLGRILYYTDWNSTGIVSPESISLMEGDLDEEFTINSDEDV